MKLPRAQMESLMKAIVESSDDAIISKDLNGIITSWNKGAERLFGYTAEEAVGKPVSILAPPGRNEMPTILDRLKSGERIDHYETVRRAKNGRLLNISLTVSPLYDETGRMTGASKIARDITERTEAANVLAKQSERILRANADLQQFAYVTSHDLQEPLRTILACTEMFLRKSADKLDTGERELLGFVTSAARRMTAMIADLLSYARTIDEDLPVTAVPITEVLEWACNNLRVAIETCDAQIRYDKTVLPVVAGNKVALLQLFQNLLGNALKYRSAEPPRIDITAERQNGMWLFSIADNGIGIAPAYHDKIFGLFQRLHTNQEYSGTGIGLALCRKIVQTHGGRIWVDSELGRGAVFKFTLPADTPS